MRDGVAIVSLLGGEMVSISEDIYADEKIFSLDFDKTPMPSGYSELPFIYERGVADEGLCRAIIDSIDRSKARDAKIQSGFDRTVRHTTLHQLFAEAKELYLQILHTMRPKIERFFSVTLSMATEPQFLEYGVGGHYACHADNGSLQKRGEEIVGFRITKSRRKVTTLLFLNSHGRDFLGGELEFCYLFDKSRNTIRLQPQAGDFLAFPSHALFMHQVHPVTRGTRYAIAQWHDII